MSLEVLLIPAGIAVIAALKEARSSDLCEKCKTTRITDQQLLTEALAAIGAADMKVHEGRVTGLSSLGPFTFQRIGEVFLGRVDKNESQTEVLLSQLDQAAGAILQHRTVENVRAQAAAMGMKLITQQAVDGNIELVFEEAP